jgi:aspartate-semialdehyde dehydrogenase
MIQSSEHRPLRLAIIGATGMVGATMLRVLEERDFPLADWIPVASPKSVGKVLNLKGLSRAVVAMEEAVAWGADVALFSAGGETSLQWAPRFAAAGTTVIDNSSAWRMDPSCPLVVPEVNGKAIRDEHLIIGNPNCTTMQLMMALKPIHDQWGVERGVVSTYQSVTGTGVAAVKQLNEERAGTENISRVYPYPIDQNCIPHCDSFQANGYTREEMKVWHESKKILNDDEVALSCTAVRVPVVGGHSESVYLELRKPFELGDVRTALSAFPGVTLQDDPVNLSYPMPLHAAGKDDVFVGRIRKDLSHPRGLHLWIVADNLRKGAATNTVQIAAYLHRMGRWS